MAHGFRRLLQNVEESFEKGTGDTGEGVHSGSTERVEHTVVDTV